MKLSGHLTIACVGLAGCALTLWVVPAGAESRESQRVKPVFEKTRIEKPVYARPGKIKPHLAAAPRVVFPRLEKLQPDRRGHEKPIREKAALATPDTVEIYRRPGDANRMEGFHHPSWLRISARNVPGSGKSLDAYRLGTRPRIEEYTSAHGRYYFRNQNVQKPDSER